MPEAGDLTSLCSGCFAVWLHIPPPQDYVWSKAAAASCVLWPMCTLAHVCSCVLWPMCALARGQSLG